MTDPAKTTGKRAESVETIDAIETHVERRMRPNARFSLLERIVVSRGDKSDWELLKDLHYKHESEPFGPHFWKAALDGETIGCIAVTPVKLLLKERHLAFPKLKPGNDTKLTNSYRANFLNANFRLISRFVLDTMYRGVGAGYRMMNLVARLEGVKYMEIQSSMSKFNHFGPHAGFKFVKPSNSNKFDVGVRFFRETFEAAPHDTDAILAEIENKSPSERAHLLEDTRQFYYRHSALEKTGANRDNGTARVDAMEPKELIKQLQQMTLASPMYGVYLNPDCGRNLPDVLPLTAFDRQAPNQPLVL